MDVRSQTSYSNAIFFSFFCIAISFDEKTFARKVVKIYRTLKKMEYSKRQEPNFSEGFCELADILLQNYKDSSSIANSSIIGGSSNTSDYM